MTPAGHLSRVPRPRPGIVERRPHCGRLQFVTVADLDNNVPILSRCGVRQPASRPTRARRWYSAKPREYFPWDPRSTFGAFSSDTPPPVAAGYNTPMHDNPYRAEEKPRRRWFQFRLSTWFVLVAILAWAMME